MPVWEMVPDYKTTALGHALMQAIKDLTPDRKEKLLRILDILKE